MQFNNVAPISIFCRKRSWNREYMHGVEASDIRKGQIKERSEILSCRESSTGVKRDATLRDPSTTLRDVPI